MHSQRPDSPPAPHDAEEERIPWRRLAMWSVAFAVIALGLVLYFLYHARVSPLID